MSAATQVFAANPSTDNTLASDLETLKITQAFEEGSSALLIGEDGVQIPLDLELEVFEDTSKSIFVASCDTSAPKVYTVRATVKTEPNDGRYSHYGIDVSGSLVMKWIDVEGPRNQIINISGLWSVASGTVRRYEIGWGGGYATPMDAPFIRSVSRIFDETVYFTTDSDFGTVQAQSTAYLTSPSAPSEQQLMIKVKPSVWD